MIRFLDAICFFKFTFIVLKLDFLKKTVALLLLFVAWPMLAQTPHAINYGISEGLPSNNVYYAFQDADHYLWFATDVGVVKFNGQEFEHFNTDDGLPDNEVFQIFQDSKRRIWFITLNGKLGFYSNYKFYNEKNTPWLRNNILNSMLIDAYDDGKGHVMLTDRLSGIYKIGGQNKQTEMALFKYKATQENTNAIRLFFDQNQTQVLTVKGIYALDGRPVLRFPPSILKSSVVRSGVLDGHLYFNSGNKIYRYHARKLVLLFSLPIDPTQIISVHAETATVFWIGTRDGLYRVEKTPKDYRFRKFLDTLSVSHWMKDHDGNYWVTTLEEGIFMIPNLDVSITDNLKNNKITVVSKDAANTLWAGSSEAYYYHFGPSGVTTFDTSDGGKNMIKDIVHTPSETFIIGNKSVTINANGNEKPIPVGHNTLVFDRQGNYWLGGTIVSRFTENQYRKLTFEQLSYIFQTTLKLQKRTNKLVLGKGDDIWVGTNFGLYKYSPKDSMQNYTAKLGDINSSVEDLYFDDANNRLLVATNSMGVIILEDKKIAAHLGKRDNLSSNTCRSIYRAGENSYWIGTNTGLDRISLRDGKFTVENFNSYVGLENGKINDIVMIRDTLYLATDKGIVHFNPYQMERKPIRSSI